MKIFMPLFLFLCFLSPSAYADSSLLKNPTIGNQLIDTVYSPHAFELFPFRDTLKIEKQGSGEIHEFHVDLALTIPQMKRGLMFRTRLQEDYGMLFWWGGTEAERKFWMKNVYVPLDILFIRQDGTIHHMHEMATPFSTAHISSVGEVAAALELPGGTAYRLGLLPDDKIIHRFFD